MSNRFNKPILSFSVETRQFRQTANAFMRETKQDVHTFLGQWGGVLVKDLINWTPPRASKKRNDDGTLGKENMNFGAQRKAGEGAVLRDVKRLYQPIEKLKVFSSPTNERLGKAIKKLVEQERFDTLAFLLKRIGIRIKGVLHRAEASIHRQARTGRNAHVAKGISYIVLSAKSIDAYARQVLPHVGKLKAGWMTAARALNVQKIPSWISRHKTPGFIVDDRRNPRVPSITVVNASSNTKDLDPNRFIAPAVEINRKKVAIALRKIIANRMKKASVR